MMPFTLTLSAARLDALETAAQRRRAQERGRLCPRVWRTAVASADMALSTPERGIHSASVSALVAASRLFHTQGAFRQVQRTKVRVPRHAGLATSPSCGTSRLGLQASRSGFAALLALFTSGLVVLAAELAPPIILESPNAQDAGLFAEIIASVPDVSGDGKADIIVAAMHEEPDISPTDAGRVYLFDGVTRQLLRELKSPGERVNSNFGNAVAGIGDIDGDGRGDVIVSTEPVTESRVYVFSGATGALIHRISTGARDVSAVPDVNGDGRPEIITADGYSGTGVNLYDGASGTRLRTFTSPNPASGSGRGDGRSFFGWSISGIADVNGDGRGDVIVGAFVDDLPRTPERPRTLVDAGSAYVFDGATGKLLHTLTAPNPQTDDRFGRSVAGLADVNGDGRGDVAVGHNPARRAYIFDGATGALLHTLNNPGEESNIFGWVLNALPDVNGDGRGDVVVSGFPDWHFGTSDKAYVFSGATGELLATLPGHSDNGGGRTVAGLPDVNGDGNGEVLVAGPYSDSAAGVFRAGQALLYLSTPTPRPPQPTALGWSAEGFKLRLTGEIDIRYELQSSEDLKIWRTVVNQTHTNKVMEFLDLDARNASQRFYRTRTVQ